MRKSSVYFFVVLTLLSLGLTLVPSAFSQTSQFVSSGGNGNLELTMVLEKAVYSLGEPVTLTLTITNISNQTINFTHTGLDFDFRVYNDTNNVVYQWSNFRAIAQFIAIVPLHAGESMSANFTWLQTCNFSASVEGDPVSPGTYNIIGQTGPTYGIQTTPMQLTITLASTSTPAPTSTPTPSPTSTPSPITVSATTDTGLSVNLTISGNITSSQMSNVTIATEQFATSTTEMSTISTILSFNVTGASGTTGFGNITIPISAVLYGTTPTIYIDNQLAQNQGYTKDSTNYYVWYATHFSTHEVSIVFTAKSSIPEFPSSVILSLVIILAVSIAVVLTLKNHKIGKN